MPDDELEEKIDPTPKSSPGWSKKQKEARNQRNKVAKASRKKNRR